MDPQILILEHDPNDIELIQYELKKSFSSSVNTFVQNEQEFRAALLQTRPDVILSDFNLPSFNGINAFKVKQEILPEIPFIIVSGTLGEQRAVDLIKMGATDYVLKENLYQIPIKIRRALQEAEERKQKKQVEIRFAEQNEQIRNILESITDGFFSVTSTSIVNYWNPQAESLLGKKATQILDKNLWEEFDYKFSDKFYNEFHTILKTGEPSIFEDFFEPLQMWLHVNAYPSKDGVSFFIRNINEIKRSEAVNELEREVLAIYTTKGLSTEAALEHLLNGLKKIHPDLICNVLRAKDGFLYAWAQSHVASSLISKMNGMPIAEDGPASSVAAFTKTPCAITDISTAPVYKRFHEIIRAHNLKSCVAFPVTDNTQQIIGTFTICLTTIRELTPDELKTLEKAGQMLRHILENRLAKLAIQESEQKYKRLFQLNPLPMWVYDQQTLRFIDINQAAIDHYGYSREQFLKMSISDLLVAEAKEDFGEMLPRILGQKPIRGTFKHKKKNGEVIDVASQSNVIHYAEKKARLVLINDITEKVIAKKTLELSEKRFKALVQKGSDLINIVDPAGNLIYSNPSFGRLLGLNDEEIIGRNAFDFIHDDDKPILTQALNLYKSVDLATFRVCDSNGNYRWLESTFTNLCSEPAVQGILINSNDITENIEHINAIELQNSKLKEIAWIQSHIVRAPLSRILGLSNLILDSPDDDREELLRYLRISALELDEVIKDIVLRSEEAERYKSR